MARSCDTQSRPRTLSETPDGPATLRLVIASGVRGLDRYTMRGIADTVTKVRKSVCMFCAQE
jgi:hypothetical protein